MNVLAIIFLSFDTRWEGALRATGSNESEGDRFLTKGDAQVQSEGSQIPAYQKATPTSWTIDLRPMTDAGRHRHGAISIQWSR
jgi:hypothetical protein